MVNPVWISRVWLSLPLLIGLAGVIAASGPLLGLAVILGLAGFIARYWSRHALDRLRYERRIPENRAFAGERFSMTLRMVNDKLLPVPWLEVRDLIPEALPIEDEHLAPSSSPGAVFLCRSTHLSWYERVNWPLEFDTPPRGFYRLGPNRITSGDIFGFFPAFREDEDNDSIIVYPKTYTLPELGLPSERPFGERKGRERIFEDPAGSPGCAITCQATPCAESTGRQRRGVSRFSRRSTSPLRACTCSLR